MKLSLSELAHGTEFSLDGKKYKKSGSWWGCPSKELLDKNQTFHSKSDVGCEGCSPYFGGKYQDALTVWVPADTLIEVY